MPGIIFSIKEKNSWFLFFPLQDICIRILQGVMRISFLFTTVSYLMQVLMNYSASTDRKIFLPKERIQVFTAMILKCGWTISHFALPHHRDKEKVYYLH